MGITQPFDVNVANNALRFGNQMLIGYANYTKSMGDKKSLELSGHIKELLKIQEEYKEILYFGDYLEKRGAKVTAGSPVRYGVFKNKFTGKRACVITNLGEERQKVKAAFADGNQFALLVSPFKKTRKIKLPLSVELKGNSLIIIVEA